MKGMLLLTVLMAGVILVSGCVDEQAIKPTIKVSLITPLGVGLGVDIPIKPGDILFTKTAIDDIPDNSSFATRFSLSNPLDGSAYSDVFFDLEYDKNRVTQFVLREPSDLKKVKTYQSSQDGIPTTVDRYEIGSLNKGMSQEFLFLGTANILGLDKEVTTMVKGYIILQNGTVIATGSNNIKIVNK